MAASVPEGCTDWRVRLPRTVAIMSTMRRRLGTGPILPTTPAGPEQPRLLAAERIEPGALLEARGNDQMAAAQKGRRNLGSGITMTPDP